MHTHGKAFTFFASLLLVSSISVSKPTFAATTYDIGFLPGTVWLSNDTPDDGQMVAVHTVVYNGSDQKLGETVQFMDSDTILGERKVTVSPASILDVSIKWTATAGDHSISSRIVDASFSGTAASPVQIDHSQTAPIQVSVPVASPLVADAISSADTAPLNTIDNIQTDIGSHIPSGVAKDATGIFSGIESFRTDAGASFADSAAALHHDIDINTLENAHVLPSDSAADKAASIDPVAAASNSLKTPCAYVKLYFFELLAFIFGNKYVFYAVSAGIIFLLVRFIIGRFR